MAPQQKGKQGTKGAKQIVDENASTLTFYQNMIFGSLGLTFLIRMIFSDGYNFTDVAFFLLGAGILIACIQFMKFMAKPKYTESNQLLDSGVDLNMESGVAEHVKDVIILTSFCEVISVFTNYFWCLWLLVPIKGLYYAWVKLLAPWVFAPAPEPSATEEKKAKRFGRVRR